jgi:hypothetical protein
MQFSTERRGFVRFFLLRFLVGMYVCLVADAPDGLVTPIEGTADLEASRCGSTINFRQRDIRGVFAHLVPDFPRKSCSRIYDQLWRRVWAGSTLRVATCSNRAPSQGQHYHASRSRRPPPLHLRFRSAVAATPLSTQHWISGRATLRSFILIRKQCLDRL